jgi:hypothetical protein
MKRFTIVSRDKGNYTIPVIEKRSFDSPFYLGSYCADNGSLWTSLDDGKHIFTNEEDAKNRLKEIIADLFA